MSATRWVKRLRKRAQRYLTIARELSQAGDRMDDLRHLEGN